MKKGEVKKQIVQHLWGLLIKEATEKFNKSLNGWDNWNESIQ